MKSVSVPFSLVIFLSNLPLEFSSYHVVGQVSMHRTSPKAHEAGHVVGGPTLASFHHLKGGGEWEKVKRVVCQVRDNNQESSIVKCRQKQRKHSRHMSHSLCARMKIRIRIKK